MDTSHEARPAAQEATILWERQKYRGVALGLATSAARRLRERREKNTAILAALAPKMTDQRWRDTSNQNSSDSKDPSPHVRRAPPPARRSNREARDHTESFFAAHSVGLPDISYIPKEHWRGDIYFCVKKFKRGSILRYQEMPHFPTPGIHQIPIFYIFPFVASPTPMDVDRLNCATISAADLVLGNVDVPFSLRRPPQGDSRSSCSPFWHSVGQTGHLRLNRQPRRRPFEKSPQPRD